MLVIQIKTIFKETISDHVTFTTVKILKMNTKFDYFYSSVQPEMHEIRIMLQKITATV